MFILYSIIIWSIQHIVILLILLILLILIQYVSQSKSDVMKIFCCTLYLNQNPTETLFYVLDCYIINLFGHCIIQYGLRVFFLLFILMWFQNTRMIERTTEGFYSIKGNKKCEEEALSMQIKFVFETQGTYTKF